MIPIIRKPTVLITIPRTPEPPTRVLAQPPAPASPKLGLTPPTRARSPSLCPGPFSGTAGAKVMLHQLLISCPTAIRTKPTLLPFLFSPPCDLFGSVEATSQQQQLMGMSHAPNIGIPIKSKPGCSLQWSWTGTSLLRIIKTNCPLLPFPRFKIFLNHLYIEQFPALPSFYFHSTSLLVLKHILGMYVHMYLL